MARRTAEQALRDDLVRAKVAEEAARKWHGQALVDHEVAIARMHEAETAVERAIDHVSRLALALEALTGIAVTDEKLEGSA